MPSTGGSNATKKGSEDTRREPKDVPSHALRAHSAIYRLSFSINFFCGHGVIYMLSFNRNCHPGVFVQPHIPKGGALRFPSKMPHYGPGNQHSKEERRNLFISFPAERNSIGHYVDEAVLFAK